MSEADYFEGDCNTGSEPGLSFEEVLRRYPSARKQLMDRIPEIREDAIREYTESKSTVIEDPSKKYKKQAVYLIVAKIKDRGIDIYPFYDKNAAIMHWEETKSTLPDAYLCKIQDSTNAIIVKDNTPYSISKSLRELMVDAIKRFNTDPHLNHEKIDTYTLMQLVEWLHYVSNIDLEDK